MGMQKLSHDLVNRVCLFEDVIEEAVAEIDQTGTSRIELQRTLDSVRETLTNARVEPLAEDAGEQEINEGALVANPFSLFGKMKEYSAGFWTEDGEYHNATLKGRNVAAAKRYARKGWGKNIEFDVIEEM